MIGKFLFLPRPLAVMWVNRWTFSSPSLSSLPSHHQLFVFLGTENTVGMGGCGSLAVYAILFSYRGKGE